MTQFADIGLAAPLLKALAAEGYDSPTPIQQGAIPHILAGHDLLGVAQTGTGKTAAFALPILNHLQKINRRASPKACRVLVLSPTRELASQIQASFVAYAQFLRVSTTVVFGGVPIGRQIRAMANGVDVVVATPGRLLDLINQRALTLAEVELLVLDEADRMLDMGFVRDIRKLLSFMPKQRQSLFFSATMPPEIADLAATMLTNPKQVAVTPVASTVDRIQQSVIHSATRAKQATLHKLLEDSSIERAVVFSRTKHGADRIVRHLEAAGLSAAAIHGNKSQNARERALASFRDGTLRLLVATDIAARGIDVDGVTHVINFDLPNIAESYVHRIGRTARAGADGIAISLVGEDERSDLRAIERLIRRQIPVLPHPLGDQAAIAAAVQAVESARVKEPARRPERPAGQHRHAQGGRPTDRSSHAAHRGAAGQEAQNRRRSGQPARARRPGSGTQNQTAGQGGRER
ncbi:DEAD/DEAH box helicase [Lichenifustis flavocetrariae]|uniref:DEAD-box ATP-dependent RNA helicase RhpA n=1 Tax=Lichenifustis flavocetrariae TaxID=2949735 RepID=A0AA42CKB3_9HYPH|nr:DEAD/DEAH box helicase [Lichenifustis flavocetrariae]MCW6509061.1 DEAD/DEAH box helicase [Lichenifustis flavocetrariae]